MSAEVCLNPIESGGGKKRWSIGRFFRRKRSSSRKGDGEERRRHRRSASSSSSGTSSDEGKGRKKRWGAGGILGRKMRWRGEEEGSGSKDVTESFVVKRGEGLIDRAVEKGGEESLHEPQTGSLGKISGGGGSSSEEGGGSLNGKSRRSRGARTERYLMRKMRVESVGGGTVERPVSYAFEEPTLPGSSSPWTTPPTEKRPLPRPNLRPPRGVGERYSSDPFLLGPPPPPPNQQMNHTQFYFHPQRHNSPPAIPHHSGRSHHGQPPSPQTLHRTHHPHPPSPHHYNHLYQYPASNNNANGFHHYYYFLNHPPRAGSASPRLNGHQNQRLHHSPRHLRTGSNGSLSSGHESAPSPFGSIQRIRPGKEEGGRVEGDLEKPLGPRPLSVVVERGEASDTALAGAMEKEKVTAPTPPERKSSKVSQPPSSLPSPSSRPRSNLEDALNELEEIYKSLKTGEEEDAEGRESLSNMGAEVDSRDGSLSPSWSSRVTDDMAYRRLNKKEKGKPGGEDPRELVSRAGSYLLVSPALSPPPFTPRPLASPPSPNDHRRHHPSHRSPATNEEPDVTLDDVVYRSVTQKNNSLKIADPQPLFGIPVGPISSAADSDYLHASPPVLGPRKPSPVPNIVTDDLAFRNLRKDSQEGPGGSRSVRKKAGRSLSANLSGYILDSGRFHFHTPRQEVNNNIQKTRLDPSEGLRLAQKMLENRRKALAVARGSPPPISKKHHPSNPSKDELRREFFAEAYKSLDESQESRLLRKLEEEAKATSRSMGKELEELDKAAAARASSIIGTSSSRVGYRNGGGNQDGSVDDEEEGENEGSDRAAVDSRSVSRLLKELATSLDDLESSRHCGGDLGKRWWGDAGVHTNS